jgi:hypothetical protein
MDSIFQYSGCAFPNPPVEGSNASLPGNFCKQQLCQTCFSDRTNLDTAIDNSLADGSSGAGYFERLYGSIESWCFSPTLKSFANLFDATNFSNRARFNADISGWVVSGVTDMSYMVWLLDVISIVATNYIISHYSSNLFHMCWVILNIVSGIIIQSANWRLGCVLCDINAWYGKCLAIFWCCIHF